MSILFTYHVNILWGVGLIFVYLIGKVLYKEGPIMEVSFATSKLHKIFNSEKKLRGEYGAQMAAIIQQRMNELAIVENLGVMRSIVGANCHELAQDRKGFLAVRLKHPYRLVFRPDQKPIPHKSDGGLDWDRVVSIEITEVVDYH